MKARSASTSNDLLLWGQGNGSITNTYSEGNESGVLNQGSDSFSFTGFGSNDKRRRSVPTPGTYNKTKWLPVRVYDTPLFWRVWNSTYWHHTTAFGSAKPKNWDSYYGNFNSGKGTSYMERHTVALSRYLVAEHDPRAWNDAVQKFMDKLKNSELNLAVSLGEYRETQRMVRNAVASAGRVVTMARRLRRELLHNPSLVISKAWLGMKYGWLPLYNDVYNLLNHTTHTYNSTVVRTQRRIKTSQTLADKNVYLGKLGWYVNRTCKVNRVSMVEFKAKVSPSSQEAFELSRITSLNPLTVAWELTPFSFVVDWFYDVGGYLAAQEFALANGLIFSDGYSTRTSWVDAQEWWTPSSGTGVAYGQKYNVIKERLRMTSFPRPMSPVLKLDLGSQRIMSAASLLRTVLLGGLKH